MRVIIAGSRTIKPTKKFISFLIKHFKIKPKVIVNGGAKGVDRSGKSWAISKGIKVKTMKADWEQYGRSAGHIRNKQMAKYGDELLLIWDGNSAGSKNMKYLAIKNKLKIYEVKMKG